MIALVEPAPGATRGLVLDGDSVVAAHLVRDDEPLPVGMIAPARLVARIGAGRARAMIAGSEALLDPAPADWHEGQSRLAQVVRAARSDGARDKHARIAAHPGPARAAPSLAETLAAAGHDVQMVPVHGPDLLAQAGWDDVAAQAQSGVVDFPGGRLLMVPTPAMLVIDVDGDGDLARLAEGAARAAAAAIACHGIGGPIVVDFPTLAGRSARSAVDRLLADHLPAPFEKTAMNGFGLVQIIRPRGAPSLLEAARRPGFAALELLRRAMRLTGAVTISGPAAVHDWLAARPALTGELARLTGGRAALVLAEHSHVQTG
ncbi:ribonuclease [Sandarakinorhabdus sp.]|uniref:ribonuclease n=1 Tax=Sandarakinorhabdus sp. TaxID=1916663 RepID=UPI003342D0A5